MNTGSFTQFKKELKRFNWLIITFSVLYRINFKYNLFLKSAHINSTKFNWLWIYWLTIYFVFFKPKYFLICLRAWSLFWAFGHNLSICLLKSSTLSVVSYWLLLLICSNLAFDCLEIFLAFYQRPYLAPLQNYFQKTKNSHYCDEI